MSELQKGSADQLPAEANTPNQSALDATSGFLNAPVFVMLYLLFMLPSYLLPWLGSNSAVFAYGASLYGASNPFFWAHLASLTLLSTLAWVRGGMIGRNWLVVLPGLATAFDLLPILSFIPFVPTALHVCSMVIGSKNVSDGTPAPLTSPPGKWAVGGLATCIFLAIATVNLVKINQGPKPPTTSKQYSGQPSVAPAGEKQRLGDVWASFVFERQLPMLDGVPRSNPYNSGDFVTYVSVSPPELTKLGGDRIVGFQGFEWDGEDGPRRFKEGQTLVRDPRWTNDSWYGWLRLKTSETRNVKSGASAAILDSYVEVDRLTTMRLGAPADYILQPPNNTSKPTTLRLSAETIVRGLPFLYAEDCDDGTGDFHGYHRMSRLDKSIFYAESHNLVKLFQQPCEVRAKLRIEHKSTQPSRGKHAIRVRLDDGTTWWTQLRSFESERYLSLLETLLIDGGETRPPAHALTAPNSIPPAPVAPQLPSVTRPSLPTSDAGIKSAWRDARTAPRDKTNIRSQPSTDAPVAGQFEPSQPIQVRPASNDNWYEVRIGQGNVVGFVRGDRLDLPR